MELYQKKIAFLGDSITEGHGVSDPARCYWNVVARRSGALCYGYGVGGTHIAVQRTQSPEPRWDRFFASRIPEMIPDADAVVVFGGTNDFGIGDAAFGVLGDRTEQTFCGAFHLLLEKLIERYPQAQLAVMTPLHREGENNVKRSFPVFAQRSILPNFPFPPSGWDGSLEWYAALCYTPEGTTCLLQALRQNGPEHISRTGEKKEGINMLHLLSEKQAALAVKILSLCLAAALSFFVAAPKLPEMNFVKDSLESVEDSRSTVMKFSAATLSASLAISALPDDFATPLADSLADMNTYFIAILAVLFLEKILIQYGTKAAFMFLIPSACLVGCLFILTRKNLLKDLAARLCIFGLAMALVVPCSTHITNIVASDLTAYVNETIEETENGAGKLNEAMESGAGDQTIFEKLSELFQTAIRGISDLMLHFQNTIRRCMNSIAILILSNCLMPLLTVFVLKWILGEIFQIAIPAPSVKRRRGIHPEANPDAHSELVSAGEKGHEK